MKQSLSNFRVAFWIACGGLLLANGWIGWTALTQWNDAIYASDQLVQLKSLAQQIETLRQKPVQTDEGMRSNDALARLVENAAKQVNLNPEQIVRIDPGDSRHIDKTPYLEQRTSIELREVSLQKIVELSLAMEGDAVGLNVPMISVRIPAGNEASTNSDELWNAQIVLTCRIYEGNLQRSLRTSLP